MYFCRLFRLSYALFFLLLCYTAKASPVGSPDGFPMAAINQSNDWLMAGNWRLLISWNGRIAALPLSQTPATEIIFGGMIERSQWKPGSPAAIACGGRTAYLYYPTRSADFPAGRWVETPGLKRFSTPPKQTRCALSSRGSYALLSNKEIVLDGERRLTLESNLAGEVFAFNDGFLLLGRKQIATLSTNGLLGTPIDTPFSTSDDMARLAVSDRAILQASSAGVMIAAVSRSTTDSQLRLDKAERLPISPCDDGQMCGASLALDGTWAVSGAWGTYLGAGMQFARLPLPNLAIKGGGIAFAHSGRKGHYVYIGNDDADTGTLPASILAGLNGFQPREVKNHRTVVWLKNQQESLQQVIGLWTPATVKSRENFHESQLPIVVHHGDLPKIIPQNWAAWEPEIGFEPIPVKRSGLFKTDSEALPNSWWPRRISRDAAIDAVAAKGIIPSEVVVALVDTGSQMNHPWLMPVFARNPGEIAENHLDDEDNGFVDDLNGYDFVRDMYLPEDSFGHGTHVAGLVNSRDPTNGALLGTAPNARTRIVRALDQSGKSNSIDLARAVKYAVDSHADIINCSWGGGPDTQILRDTFAHAIANHTLVFSSAGNDANNTDIYPQVPKKYPGVIVVGALQENGSLASFSSWGARSVSWFVPGHKILSTVIGSTLGEMSGTSMASPIGAGMAAWILGILRATQGDAADVTLKQRTIDLLCSTSDTGSLAGKSRCGRADLLRATQKALAQ